MIEMFINVYLPHFFDWLIETSIMAIILVGLILCIRVLFRNKLTPRWQYMLWIILIIRLVLPWSPESSYSIYSVLTYKNDDAFISSRNPVTIFLSKEHMQELKGIDDTKVPTKEDTYTSSSTQNDQANKTQTHNNEKQDDETVPFYTICIYIWLTGVILLSFATFIMNRRLLLYIKKQSVITDEKIVQIFEKCKQSMSVQRDVPLLVSGKVSSPTVFGFIRPKLLLSTVHMKILDEQQLRYIFHHELAHIKRRDVGVNWLMHGLLILNWFNPILWYAYSCMREDQELACDALALTCIDSEEQIAYGHTIISLLEHYSSYYQVPSLANFSKNKRMLKRRILMIKKFQKKSYRWSALGAVAVIAVSSVSLLNARADMPTNPEKQQIEVKNNRKELKTQPDIPIQQIVEKMIGTKEQADAEFLVSEGEYNTLLKELGVARNLFTKEEFERFIELETDAYTLGKKVKLVGNPEKLNAEEQKKYEKNVEEIGPFRQKIYSHFRLSKKEAQKYLDFPIKTPTYVVKGYKLTGEDVQTPMTTEKIYPDIVSQYQNEDSVYVVHQSAVRDQGENSLNEGVENNEKITNYELEGTKINLTESPENNTKYNMKVMKMIVPAKGKNSAYQVLILTDSLSKEELEKIMLSFLK
ncbi:beta-lactam sensor/signal transducer [Bacillus wiedmannii]|uniref:beta-lactam sensor/signal transducer n=2 Tax=Bacillus wiedmannii TaxID=1890302 RepID=UPI00065B8992|nr:beta-lactam sensor/signal transducer [Bacillus wiedmannii]KMP77755.1 beta-lactamase regulatory protein [Bacillus cereus]MCQ6574702.1 beta-lactam sensor/signal transducer [Bacillus wiedmannii]MCU5578041.1 beta-lactam sensor/signal transducer [Bacillus wiedmannii]WMS79994.1 beta-lactam sensor/signal transducer [Bacillus wiedmannii]HDR7675820.1 beta-lactam sensor/signal transducer [Bacillus wiedmannii]